MENKILIIDNYDSFTYNLVHLVNEIGMQCEVWRNDQFNIDDVDAYDKIILSPGPGIPSEAGLLLEVIKKYAPTKSIFGVCLGQQAIAEVFGGKLYNLKQPMHGIATPIKVTDETEKLFLDLPQVFNVGRYHSWVVDEKSIPDVLTVTAIDEVDNSAMACWPKHTPNMLLVGAYFLITSNNKPASDGMPGPGDSIILS